MKRPAGRMKGEGVPANFHGAKGRSGRKTMIEEREIADLVKSAFFLEGVDMKKIAKIQNILASKKGRIKLFDLVLVKAISREPILMTLFQKLYPDELKLSGGLALGIGELTKKKIDELKQ